MKLVHYTDEPVGPLSIRPQTREEEEGGRIDLFKPRGLWVSDDACDDNWKAWCESEQFGLERLALAYDVTLAAEANVLLVSSIEDIDKFTKTWAVHPYPEIHSNVWIDWPGVRAKWDGMIITPYIWGRRLSYGSTDAMWYYSWDCASGCIWDPRAIASMTLRDRAGEPL